MCGILGHLSLETDPNLEQKFKLLLNTLHHRGPDDRGYFIRNKNPGSIALGHTRLSIIDLSTAGHQPMHSEDGRYTIIFNGEIYNYRELRTELQTANFQFYTDSDTEVLLAAWVHWGVDGLRGLTGMFAFAVYDRYDESFTIVRDAFGIKPLFYTATPTSFNFASEVPALLSLLPGKPAFDLQQIYEYLVFGCYDDQARTFYQGILNLLPGHWLRLDFKSMQTAGPQRWWWPPIDQRNDLSFNDAAAQLRELFLNNIRLHLRSDVPLGAALSGGLDSSSVVCAMRHLEPKMPIYTFSFIAPGSVVDEERWVDLVNNHVGAIPQKIMISPKELGEDLDEMILGQGEPFGSTSIYAQYRVFQMAHKAGITVTLDGQGADELLAGYDGYPSGYIHSLLDQHRYLEILRFLNQWAQWPGRGYLSAFLMLGKPLVPTFMRGLAYKMIGRNPIPSWIDAQYLVTKGIRLTPPPLKDSSEEALGRRLVADLRAALTGKGLASLLRHGDRNSMHWSIESRVPFLTIEIAEFLLSLPETYLLGPDGETKRIFRAAMRGLVPDEILDRRDKIGFQTPETDWLRNQNNKTQEWLLSAESLPFLKAKECRDKVKLVLGKNNTFRPQIWRLINFCRWVELNR